MRASPGQQMLSQEVVTAHRRVRVAEALGECVAEEPLRPVTVGSVVRQAKMARSTFYGLFDNLDQAFRFGVALGNSRLRGAVEAELAKGESWPARIDGVVEALLETARVEQDLARLALLFAWKETPVGGPYDPALVDLLAGVMRSGRRDTEKPGPPPRTEELLAFGMLFMVAERLKRGDAESLTELAGEMSQLVQRPFFA